MFFVGIFGIQDRQKVVREIANLVCENCGRYSRGKLIYEYTYFHLFFIPLFRWNKRYFLQMQCCGAIYHMDAEYGKQLENGAELDFRKMSKASGEYGDTWICPQCGARLQRDFRFCPYCGYRK